MQRTMLKSKIRGGKISTTELHYEGSVAIDRLLMEAADILPGEQVHVLNVNNRRVVHVGGRNRIAGGSKRRRRG